ncbi:hypothetical protein ACH5RR_021411 [Cinchona calisaya]|uniref:Uncharacterized protein n=1 Tax=Cinchona calisaya TaxID=153742 RepID=A0ABD2ZL15_9GENT
MCEKCKDGKRDEEEKYEVITGHLKGTFLNRMDVTRDMAQKLGDPSVPECFMTLEFYLNGKHKQFLKTWEQAEQVVSLDPQNHRPQGTWEPPPSANLDYVFRRPCSEVGLRSLAVYHIQSLHAIHRKFNILTHHLNHVHPLICRVGHRNRIHLDGTLAYLMMNLALDLRSRRKSS